MSVNRGIFLSHATEDGWLTQQILLEFEDDGLLCWEAARDIPEGRAWPAEIDRAIETCSLLFVLITPAANQSEDVSKEVLLARDANVPVVPIIVNDTELRGSLRYAVKLAQWHNLTIGADGNPDLTDLPVIARKVLAEHDLTPVLPPHPLSADELGSLAPAALDLQHVPETTVDTVVAAANTARGELQAPGLLIENLPNLHRLHLVVGAPSSWDAPTDVAAGLRAGRELAEKLRAHAADFGRNIEVMAPVAVTALRVERREQSALRRLLRGLPPRRGTRVDITGGTVPMPLALKCAAEATGHRVTYTLPEARTSVGPDGKAGPDFSKQSLYHGWIDVTDSFTFGRFGGHSGSTGGAA
jgi:hypothetical protein